MPARAIQGITHVPTDDWCAFCLECTWVGGPTDKKTCARQAYEHNQARHDGAGIVPQLSDFAVDATGDVALYRKMYRQGVAAAGVTLVVAVTATSFVHSPVIRDCIVGLNLGAGMSNAFLAGKWARRIEAATIG